ncbi:MAG: RluA family pseudouridine synthase [Ktedonobacterales bacterium]
MPAFTRRNRSDAAASPPAADSLDLGAISADWERLDVPDEQVGERLDRALAALRPDLSRTRAQAAIRAGEVRVNEKPAKVSLMLEAGWQLALAPTLGADTETAFAEGRPPEPEGAIPLRVVYEDDHLLVVDKPAGLVVHPAPGHASGTLVNALLAHAPAVEGGDNPARPGIVHRLDKDTSGLMVIAKDAPTHTALTEQMQQRGMVKRYLALVEGHLDQSEGVIEAPIGRDQRHRQRMTILGEAQGGRPSRTRFRVLREGRGRSLLDVQLDTGRTHQIRVHMQAIHHPVVGDLIYGRPQQPLPPRQFLHAAHLEFAHPVTGEWLAFEAPLPDDLATFLADWEA